MVKNPNGRMPTSWLFTSLAEDLNSGLLRTNPATSIQGWDMRPSNYKSSTLTTGHATSICFTYQSDAVKTPFI